MSLYRRSTTCSSTRPCTPKACPTSILEAALGDCAIIATPRGAEEGHHLPRPRLDRRRRVVAQLTDALVPALRANASPTPCAERPVPPGAPRAQALT